MVFAIAVPDRDKPVPASAEGIVRIEFVGGRFLYAIRLLLSPGSFNLCPADYCELPGMADGVSGRGLPIEAYDPPPAIVDEARRLVAAGLDVGGVEYLVVNARDGHHYFYDLNALSNFEADAPNLIGFNPYVDLVDLILQRAERAIEGVSGASPGCARAAHMEQPLSAAHLIAPSADALS